MGKILGKGNIRDRGVVTLPKEVREYLGVKEGDSILLILEHGQVVLKKVDGKSYLDFLFLAKALFSILALYIIMYSESNDDE